MKRVVFIQDFAGFLMGDAYVLTPCPYHGNVAQHMSLDNLLRYTGGAGLDPFQQGADAIEFFPRNQPAPAMKTRKREASVSGTIPLFADF